MENENFMDIEHPARKIASEITNFLNNYNSKEDELVKAMSYEHRTLQQNFTRLALRWLEHCANLPSTHYDLRNEASHNISKEMVDAWIKFKMNGALTEEYLKSKGLPSKWLPTI